MHLSSLLRKMRWEGLQELQGSLRAASQEAGELRGRTRRRRAASMLETWTAGSAEDSDSARVEELLLVDTALDFLGMERCLVESHSRS